MSQCPTPPCIVHYQSEQFGEVVHLERNRIGNLNLLDGTWGFSMGVKVANTADSTAVLRRAQFAFLREISLTRTPADVSKMR